MNLARGIIREKEILMQLDHPFILKQHTTLKDKKRLVFLTEYICGYDLQTLIMHHPSMTTEMEFMR